MTGGVRGIVEGFYGRPWTWDERVAVMQACAAGGMTHYVYAPKDDARHRARWREHYGPEELAGFARLVAEGGLQVGFGISPGLDIDHGDPGDRAALRSKVDQVVGLGIPIVMLALDDIPFDPAAGTAHAALATDLAEHLAGRASVVLVPTEYVGTSQTRYLDDLARALPAAVDVGWTGPAVVSDVISADDARARAAALGGRKPLLWDNYPVNDATMADRLFLGPLWGREAALLEECSGYLANPMVQPRSSLLPLASVAGWLRGEDPLDAWAAAAGPLQVFAEACDGAVPQALAAALAIEADGPQWSMASRPVAAWLTAAASCTAPGLEGEADEWLAQAHSEARLGLSALRLLQATKPVITVDATGAGVVLPPQPDVVLVEALALATYWPRIRRGTVSVMGPRCSFRPVLRQRSDGTWQVTRAAFDEGANAVDAIVKLALDALDTVPAAPAPVEVLVDGEPVPVAEDNTLTVPPGAEVLVVCGSAVTVERTPCGPPVPPSPGPSSLAPSR